MVHPTDLITARSVEWQVVDSTDVHSALFDESQADFYVRFLRAGPDAIYVYRNRSPEEWQDFRTALSKGSWIWNNPRAENWPFERLSTRDFAHVEPGDVPKPTRQFLE
jgi:hypothetical protein